MKSLKARLLKVMRFAIIGLLALGIFGMVFLGDEDTTADNSPEKEPTEQEEVVDKEEDTEEVEEVKIDLSSEELNVENVKTVVSNVTEVDKSDIEVIIEDNGDVSIDYFKENILSAKSEVKSNAVDSVKIFEALYKSPEVNEVWIAELAMVMDSKGNESRGQILGANTNRATVEGVDWDNMINLIYSDYTNLQDITVGYTQSKAITSELKE